MIIDLTGIHDGTSPARLLDTVEGRSKQAFKTWLVERPDAWRDQVEVVAMDGFTGFKTATAGLLADNQIDRLTALFATEQHVEVEATWGLYQRVIAAYHEEDRRRGRELMVQLIDSSSTGVPKALTEVITLGRTLKSAPPTCWPTSTDPAPATARPRPSTADSNTSAAAHSGSGT